MTASGGLQSDARRAVYEEDVVTYADDDTAEEWGDPQNYSATAVGLVSRVAGSDDEWSSDEEPEEPVPEDHSEVCWLGSTDRVEIEPNKELRVVDRAFLHGDVVARAADALGAQGVVSAVHLDLDLRFLDGSLVRNVNARRVAHVREFRPGHYVAYGDWVGKIVEVVEDVVVRFDDGAECTVLGADEETLVPHERSTLFADEEHCPYFPGAVVHAAAHVWRDARWTRGSSKEAPSAVTEREREPKKARETSGVSGGGRDDDAEATDAAGAGSGSGNSATASTNTRAPRVTKSHKKSLSARVSAMRARTKGVVFAVRASEVTVRWLACARRAESDAYDYSVAGAFPRAPRTPGPESEGGAAAPPTQMPASALRPLTHFAHTCFQLGDRTVVPEMPPPKSHSERRRGAENSADDVEENAGYDSDFPDVSASSNDRYEGGGVDGFGVFRAHRTSSAGAGVAASVCESVGVAQAVNYGLTRLFKNVGVEPFDPETNERIPPLRPASTVVGTHTYVDVIWQDGSVTRRISAKDLVPQLHLGEHDFWPGQFITRRADDANPPLLNGGVAVEGAAGVADIAAALGGTNSTFENASATNAAPRHGQTMSTTNAGTTSAENSSSAATLSPFGVVETVDNVERVARVRWLPPDSAFPDLGHNTMRWVASEERWVDFGPDAVNREDDRERVSVYEIREDDEYGFRLGDIVVAPSRFDAELDRRMKSKAPFECMLARSEKDLLDLESDDEDDDDEENDDDESSSSEYEEADDADVDDATTTSNAATTSDSASTPAPGEDRTSRSVRDKPLLPPDVSSLVWVGEVIGASDGVIRVAWGDGSISNCHPKFAWVVSHDDDEDVGSLLSGSDFDSGDESDASWETLGEANADEPTNLPGTTGNNGVESFDASRLNPDQRARRGVPEPPPVIFDGAASAIDPIARAYVERQREEAEFGWLAEHVRRAGGSSGAASSEPISSEPPSSERPSSSLDVENNANSANVSNANDASAASASTSTPSPSNALTPEEAARAAAALAAAFSGLRSAGAAETPQTRAASKENDDSSKEDDDFSKEEDDDSSKEDDSLEAFPAFATVQSGDEGVAASNSEAPSGSSAAEGQTRVDVSVADHRFKDSKAPPADLQSWSKAVRREWRTLSNSLPANVWVRVFEARTDLLRSLIVGPEETPYHDNVFVFDFSLGPRYPDEPPSASYHSRGERVNPNLYENGKVCLSLLATWAGKGTEVWDPKVSNMLQVLVSIQGLVLVDDPYYNEAGYEKQSGTEEGKRNGDQYNEQAFLASVRSMIATMRDPPMHFEQLIRLHFKKRASRIVDACAAYLNEGCPIGQYEKFRKEKNRQTDGGSPGASASKEGSPAKGPPSRPPPTEGFKLTLRKLMPKLEAAFKANDEMVDA